jgi:hypothetical protein
MEAIRLTKVVEKDGEIVMTGLPYKKGERVEMILLSESSDTPRRSALTGRRLRQSALIGLWKDRKDIQDSAAYARVLRESAQRRG